MTYTKQMQEIVSKYVKAKQPWPATSRAIAAWAIRNDLWEPHPSTVINQCADQISKAMREDYIVDPQGRTVRAKHAARILSQGKQTTFWADIRTASPQHMKIAFQQRRQQIVGDCGQLKSDLNSYNQNKNEGEPIRIVFDFTQDIEEIEGAA